MKITIITPVYNDPRIERCLKSIQQQRGDFDFEHVVVDSNSTGETEAIINAYDDQIDILHREDDDGLYDAINTGIECASGDVIGVLNADDRYQDDTSLAKIASAMEDPSVDACYGDLVYVDSQDEVVRYWESGSFNPRKFYFGWMPPHPTFYVRSEFYETLGGYDVSIPIAADYELMLRFLLKNDLSVQYINDILVRMELGGMSNASFTNRAQVIRDMYHAWDQNQSLGKYVAPFLHPLEKLPQYFREPST
jgi:glycosyltransferase involved in cell wall biosynthesis